jgi:deoxyribodipyrimidine photolyase-like uncharacterized protein
MNAVLVLPNQLFIDACDWVMVPNLYGMSQYSDGGTMTTKPYIGGSNYILRMSDCRRGRGLTIGTSCSGASWRKTLKS